MRRAAAVLLLVGMGVAPFPARAQKDFLTSQEVEDLRDQQEAGKRILLYLEFAQRRMDAVKQALATTNPRRGREAQKNLSEYNSILEALDTALAEAREKRIGVAKALKELETRGAEFRRYLESLRSESSPAYADYRYTLEESLAMTEEEVAEARKGSFPEVETRTPPSEFPATPPPPSQKGGEEGPPRKKGRGQ